MSGASGRSETPQRNRNNIPDLLRTMPVKVSVKDEEISRKTTMVKRLERFDEVRIVDETILTSSKLWVWSCLKSM